MTDEIVTGAAAAISAKVEGAFPKVALVLGSGLGRFGESMTVDKNIPYGEIPGFPVSTVAGHHGRLLIGEAGGTPLVCMQGRMHVYEGYAPEKLAVAIRTLHTLGVETLILTNAAGSLNKHMGPGSIMAIEDHINFSGRNPLIGPNDEDYGPRFFDMTTAYDAE
ncbi:MAG: purine-nucleoside phosphorylase, partial [Pseudomonadota bacterium]